MAAGAAVMMAAAAAQRRAMELADAEWAKYAKDRGFRHRPGRTGWAHTEQSRLEGTHDGVEVSLELSMAGGAMGVTALAAPASPVPTSLEITREGVLAKIAKVFGAKDLIVGDEPFDKKFMIRCTNDDAAKLLLSEEARAEMLALDVLSLAYDDGSEPDHSPMLVVSVPRVVVKPEEIDRLLSLVVKLAKTHA